MLLTQRVFLAIQSIYSSHREEGLMRQRARLLVNSILFIVVMCVVMVMGTVTVHADHNININTATVKELKTISGIGKVLAERIVEYRENEQSFKTVEDLLNVKGIGKATLEKLREHVTVGEKN